MRFEYKHETWTAADGLTFEQWLNALGVEGWEMIAIWNASPSEHRCTFKRAAKPERPQRVERDHHGGGMPRPKLKPTEGG